MIEVADIFNQYGEVYRRKHKLSSSMFKAMSAIESCRTSKLGGHIDECDDCGHIKISYNSCRNRHCPKCQNLRKERWLEERKRDLLPIPYYHVVFTIPSDLNPIAMINKKEIYALLFKASAETLDELAKDPKYLGANIGFVSVLHTWGQNLMDHPHIHCIVTGGGLSFDEDEWVPTKKNFFIPVRVMSKLFRGKFLHYVKQAFYDQKLKFHSQHKHLEFQNLLDELYEKEWVVYCKQPFKSPTCVIDYLGRYTHRVAISNHRICHLEDGKVTFKWRDYSDQNKNKLMTLDALEFIRRFLLHVLPHRFVKIRHYGILSNRNSETKIKRCKEILDIPLEKSIISAETWQELLFKITGIDLTICPVCKEGNMVKKQTLQPRCYSPPNRRVS